jgi:hypothetical protein
MSSKNKTQAKRDFDARAIENEYDYIYKNEAPHWLHYIHRMEKDPEYTPERIAKLRSAYEDFKKEAKKRKTAVKNSKATVAEFRDWTLQQLENIL